MPASDRPLTPSPPRTITLRSVLFGLAGGGLICLFVPYNDLAMQNTPLVGNNLPLAVMMLLFAFVTLVNGPLNRWRPRRAWSSFELAVAFTLMLVMCAVPSSGLMRYLLPNLVMPFHLGIDHAGYRTMLAQLGVARWAFPDFTGERAAEWIGDPLVTGFNDRWAGDGSPYRRWLVPFVSWGIFSAALAWALICLACIVMRQWRDHEHLAFPLTHIQLALLERPPPGRWLNDVLRSRSFWFAFVAVLLLHLNNGLVVYFPKHVVPISRGFDLLTILSEQPWSHTEPALRKATIYFSMIGITFFLSGPVALSLWFFFVVMQVYKMWLGTLTGDSAVLGINEQRHGVALAIFCSLVWLGRRHWALVARQAFRGERAGEIRGNYLSYPVAFWGVVGGCGLMVAWLVAAGCSVWGALDVVAVIMIAFVLITRLIAETGLIHGALPISPGRPLEMIAMYGGPKVSLDTFYLASVVHATHYDYRETVPVYTTHAMRCLDVTKPDELREAQGRRVGRRIIGLICLALMVAYCVSFPASLWTHYNYGITQDVSQASPIDVWAVRDNPRWQLVEPTYQYVNGVPPVAYSPAGHAAFGFAVTGVLSILRLTFSWWPLHPVGYLILATFPSVTFWFSIFIGWLLKVLVLRFGSARFYEQCKPFFIGLILGESAAAALWLIVSIVLHALGIPYYSYLVLPT